jgi:ubiquinone/menaquinone biosynthesis C-methylase UbiE
VTTRDPYERFAERYDLFFGEFGQHPPEQAEFLRVLFAEEGVSRVLDCACGTGNDLDLLQHMDVQPVGSDLSAAMLAQARRNFATRGAEPPLVRADFCALPYGEAVFDAVLCLTTSLPHLPDERRVIQALRSVWWVLRPGGIAVFSQGITDKLVAQQPRFIPEINTVDVSRIFVLDYGEATVCINVLDVVHEPARRDFIVDTFEYLVMLPPDYERLLAEAGFSRMSFRSGYTSETYDAETSEKLVVIAWK